MKPSPTQAETKVSNGRHGWTGYVDPLILPGENLSLCRRCLRFGLMTTRPGVEALDVQTSASICQRGPRFWRSQPVACRRPPIALSMKCCWFGFVFASRPRRSEVTDDLKSILWFNYFWVSSFLAALTENWFDLRGYHSVICIVEFLSIGNLRIFCSAIMSIV